MKKSFIPAIAILLVGICVGVCLGVALGHTAQASTADGRFWSKDQTYVYRDPETKCQYLIFIVGSAMTSQPRHRSHSTNNIKCD